MPFDWFVRDPANPGKVAMRMNPLGVVEPRDPDAASPS
jgi:hypothetical protein